ncbi:Hint domain-containing protein [Acetobacter sp.]|uniref:Hint domain-containing protein n=1 Tax=Acetobacter sp. TaxID=440 RepID=UPI0025C093C3|nr:Hint domain-containing protein [Acetobacter sp.]MCH4091667.1 Hint domain-containing protein [Acetobacter sp.]MCI1300915.1 Hint domain-containing protein [Acetobacter sp.]MCI1316208.1 Hint domain-containing protein [Acetobacter sp.]
MASVTNGGSVSGATTSSGDVTSGSVVYPGGGTGTARETVVSSGGVLTSAMLRPGDVVTVEAGGASYFTSAVDVTGWGGASPTRFQSSQENVYGLSTNGIFSGYISASGDGNYFTCSVEQDVYAGGEAYGASFTTQYLPIESSDGLPIGQVVAPAEQVIDSGGLARNTLVGYRAEQDIASGGVAIDTMVSGGLQLVEPGGVARDTTLNGLSFQQLSGAGAVAYNTTINRGALVEVYNGAAVVGVKVNDGAGINVSTGGTVSDADIGSGGVLSAGSGATLTDITLENGGRLDVSKDTLFTDRLVFNGGTIDITDLTGTGTPDYTFSGDNRLTITRDGVSETILFDGVYDPTKLLVTIDTDGSTLIDYGTPAPCYCPGTLIATAAGETPVEALAIGDLVRTASGVLRPIRWIGRRAYDGVFARGNPDLIPVTFEKGSLGSSLPKRALTVSPLHAMCVEGYLIPAHCLVNGGSIHFDSIGERVDYIHIELESHDLLLAEGAPSESFVDDGSRGMFHNAGTFAELYPDAETVEAVYCAPRLEDGTVLEHIRDRLSAHTGSTVRLGLLASDRERQLTGWAVDLLTPSEPVALEVLLDGRVIGMTLADGPSGVVSNGAAAYGFTFGLPRGVTSVSGTFSLRAVSAVKAAA